MVIFDTTDGEAGLLLKGRFSPSHLSAILLFQSEREWDIERPMIALSFFGYQNLIAMNTDFRRINAVSGGSVKSGAALDWVYGQGS